MKNSAKKLEPSKTKWSRGLAQPENAKIPYEPEDGPYDPNDAEAVEAYWNKAKITRKGEVIRKGRGPQKAPTKERISIRLSAFVLEHFRAHGPGWQTQMDEALQTWIKQNPQTKRKTGSRQTGKG